LLRALDWLGQIAIVAGFVVLIPSALKMRNFMCYRDAVPVLNFDGIHVACLCGDNGSGKSSIFDAIIWALWGKASRGKNDDLICIGQNEMGVELDFYSGANRYRILRKYTRSSGAKSGQVMLDLQVENGGKYQSIAEHIVKDTQEKITRLLHLDYPTFINSAMLLQGKSNEFSTKIPSERKDILARILDLSFYDELEEEAKAEAEKNKSGHANLERELAANDQRINEKPRLEEDLNNILSDLAAGEQVLKTMDGDVQALRRKKESLAARDEQLKLLQRQLAGRTEDMKALQSKLSESQKNVGRYNKAISGKDEIEKGYALYKDLSAREEEQNAALKQFHDLSQRKNRLEALITAAHNALSSERKVISARINELESRCSQLPSLQKKREALAVQQVEFEHTEADLAAKQKLIKDLGGLIGSVSAINSQLVSAAEEIRRKMEMISHAAAVCPLCEQELGPQEHQRISKKLEQELQQNLNNSRENTQKLAQHKTDLGKLEKEVREKEAVFRTERDKARQQTALIEKEITEIEKASLEAADKRPRLELLDAHLKEKTFAPEEQKGLAETEQEIKTLSYDQAVHEKIKHGKTEALKYDQLFRELNEARLRIESEEKAAAEGQASLLRLQEETGSLAGERDALMKELAALPDIVKQLDGMELKRSSMQATERTIRDQAAQLRENIRQIDVLSGERKEKAGLLRKFKEAESIYAELAKYFSKKGIQALIIEEALPEITNEANDLLGRMTDNRMSLALETQKGTRKGDMIETLDIKVADELGTRSYEMYSGGEAFRIDLALRIAISRLLVRRAGASMPILIIDEGFGTQDNASLEKLIDAINYIQDDFEKIFIITHLEELRDKFPVIINVVKTGEGSTISVSQ
jgi:DNA repair protein SbcC/Rad50